MSALITLHSRTSRATGLSRGARILSALRMQAFGVSVIFAVMSLMPSHAQEMQILPGSATELDLPVSQGRILKFDGPVESVVLSDPAIADLKVVSDDVIYIYGTKPGTTDLVAMTADKKIKSALKLTVIVDQKQANEARSELRLSQPSGITFFNDRPVVRGVAPNIDEALNAAVAAEAYAPDGQNPLNAANFNGSAQVNIRVRFAEVSRKGLEALGINWSAMASAGNFSFGVLKNNGGGSGTGIGGSFSGKNFSIDVLVDALKQQGILSILAEPNLTAVTGETASFLAGGEIPVPVPQDRDRIGVDYKSFGVSLQFTPTLLKGNRISLRIRPEVSTLSAAGAIAVSGFSLPSFSIRRADTAVEAASGQTFAIAGLFQRNMSQELSKFPILGDIPVLGSLFNSKRYQRDETELVILITPYLVQPVSDKSLATPLDQAKSAQAGEAISARPKAYGLIVK